MYLVSLVVWYTTSSRKASFLAERRVNTLVWRTPHHCIHRPQRKCIFDIFHHLDLSPSTSRQQSIGNARDLRQGGSFMFCCVRSPLPTYFYACFFTWISIINPCKAAIGQFLTLPNRCQESTVRFTVSISQSLQASRSSAGKKRKHYFCDFWFFWRFLILFPNRNVKRVTEMWKSVDTSSVHVKQSSHFYFYVVARPLVVRKYFQVYTVPLCIVVAWYEW